MKNGFETRGIARTIKRLFGTKSRLSPHQRFPNAYFKSVYVSEDVYNGIELVASIEKISVKKAADILLLSGISRYMAELLQRHAENLLLNRERSEGTALIATLDGIKEARKYLAEHGMLEYRSKKGGL